MRKPVYYGRTPEVSDIKRIKNEYENSSLKEICIPFSAEPEFYEELMKQNFDLEYNIEGYPTCKIHFDFLKQLKKIKEFVFLEDPFIGKASFDKLNNEIFKFHPSMRVIFDLVGEYDLSFLQQLKDVHHLLISSSQLCKALPYIKSLGLKTLRLENEYSKDELDISLLSNCTELEQLTLCDINNKDSWHLFSRLKALKQLWIILPQCRNTKSFYENVSSLQQLKRLKIEYKSHRKLDLNRLCKNMKNLKWLDLTKTNLEALETLNSLPDLEKVGCHDGITTDYQGLCGNTSLKKLTITRNNRVKDFSFLSELPFLEDLTYDVGFNSSFTIPDLSKLKNLKSFSVSGEIEEIEKIGDIKSLTHLEVVLDGVSFMESWIMDILIEVFRKLKNLKTFYPEFEMEDYFENKELKQSYIDEINKLGINIDRENFRKKEIEQEKDSLASYYCEGNLTPQFF